MWPRSGEAAQISVNMVMRETMMLLRLSVMIGGIVWNTDVLVGGLAEPALDGGEKGAYFPVIADLRHVVRELCGEEG